MKKFSIQLLVFATLSFALHYAWEQLHLPLYTQYGHLTEMPITLFATLGDVLYTLLAVLAVSLLKQDMHWLLRVRASDLVGLAIIGFAIALGVEYKALIGGRWAYADAMPIIPLLNVGLSPILQMMILLPLSVWIAARSFATIKI